MVAKMAWIPAHGTYVINTSSDPFNPNIGSMSRAIASPVELNEEKKEWTKPTDNDEAKIEPLLKNFLNAASLANLAHVYQGESGWNARGDPTEIALQVLACRFDWNREKLMKSSPPQWEELFEFPFSSEEKKMSMVMQHCSSKTQHVFTKGAVERVMAACSTVYEAEDALQNLTDEAQTNILQVMETMASRGLRVLALATKELPANLDVDKTHVLQRSEVEHNLIFCGLVGIYDPPRPESAQSVRQCHEAGISVHMLTGDHPGTARAIALDVGILPVSMEGLSKDRADSMVMTASQFDKLSDHEIDALPSLPRVVARCAPNTKVRMIEALHRRGKFAAMVRLTTTNSISTICSR